jgi:hypothetical protein
MMPLAIDWSTLSITELPSAHCAVLDELRKRDIIRSKNNPTGDYAEWLASTKLGPRLEKKSAKGWDATGRQGGRQRPGLHFKTRLLRALR